MIRFLVDAHLPFRLVRLLRERGYDALHISELPRGNATKDSEINALSLREKWVVVSKDADFIQSLILRGEPYKLLLVSTGNISNQALEALFPEQLDVLCELLNTYRYVERGSSVGPKRPRTIAPLHPRLLRYVNASARWASPIPSAPARSAMVRATRRMRS